ncbi:MAG: type 4a pilus biogenesis protein PilO [Planctomycetota bacterium]|nr:type 4a pilus biogenesis protein PilO [Planctomycetota bacterium]
MPSLKTQIGYCSRAQLALGAVLLVVLAIFLLAGYRPQTARLQQLNQDMNETEKELEVSQAQAAHLPGVTADLARLKAQLADFQHLPNNPELGEFTSQITELSRKTGLSKIELDLNGSSVHTDAYGQRGVELKFDGDFMHVFAFLRQAEAMSRLTRISSIEISGADLKSGSVHVDVKMDLYFAEG